MSVNIFDLSEEGIKYMVLGSESNVVPRSLLDVFTEEEVMSIPAHPKWHCFSIAFQDWVNNTIDGILVRNLEKLHGGSK